LDCQVNFGDLKNLARQLITIIRFLHNPEPKLVLHNSLYLFRDFLTLTKSCLPTQPVKHQIVNHPIKILHLDTNHQILLGQLKALGFENHEDYSSDKPAIEAKIQEYDGIVIRSRFKIDRAFIDKATKLKFIARVGAGLESIDTEYAAEKGIALIAAPEGNRNAVGEHTLAMLLALFNKINTADREIRNGHWNRESNRGHELDGKTVGIIGYGNMGKSFAKKLRGFDVEVLCHDILPDVGDTNARQVPLEELKQKADVLSLHIPWTNHTDKMINADFIASFAKPFWLINTSRGKNVVTQDLTDGLLSGKILGAGLDVLEYEKSSFEHLFDGEIPEAFQYLLQAENVMLSPHIAGWTHESKMHLAQVIVDKIKALYFPSPEVKSELQRVTGIGGFFFRAQNPEALKDWYRRHLGIPVDQYGWTFRWKDAAGNDCSTQWSVMKEDNKYMDPSPKQFMQNFRVANFDELFERLKAEGVTIVGTPESFDYGKFGWILDPEGNKIELWEPKDKAFL
jgi:D-3-phosphoglycerate dehydrogenase